VTVVRRLRSGEVALLKQLRLASLGDAPDAFGRTLAETLAQPEAYWTDMERSVTAPGRHAMFLAEDGPQSVGLAFGIRKPGDTADLAGMWVDPRARGAGVGRALAESVIAWGKAEGFGSLVSLYERLGFAPTGARAPLPSNTSRTIAEMQLPLTKGAALP
jgi:GNAT superfamily N-acetyltransferase